MVSVTSDNATDSILPSVRRTLPNSSVVLVHNFLWGCRLMLSSVMASAASLAFSRSTNTHKKSFVRRRIISRMRLVFPIRRWATSR
jgi:hypothetical protein